MKNNRFQTCLVLLILFVTTSLFGQTPDTMKTYIFGHSLIHHELQVNPTPSQETSVPHWFHFLAQEAGQEYAVSGQYGFLNQHARNLPPNSQWGFDSVPSAWNDWMDPWADAGFDNIMITPANFIQWLPPTANHWQDSITPIESSSMIFSFAEQSEPGINLYVYEGWPDMGPQLSNGFPPTQTEWNNYNAYMLGGYHDWMMEYYDSLALRHPSSCVRMIPAGLLISRLLLQAPFNQIPVDTLYEDSSPHGRPTIYFLAALVTYMAMYEQPAPPTYTPPAIIDSVITNNYSTVVNYFWNELQSFNNASGQSLVFCGNQVLAIEEEQNELGELEAREDWGLYPNPTSGLLHIQGEFESLHVEVVDLQGRMMKVNWTGNRTIDLNGLPEGLYCVRMQDLATGQTVVRRVVKR